jgi:hypothetical protein
MLGTVDLLSGIPLVSSAQIASALTLTGGAKIGG